MTATWPTGLDASLRAFGDAVGISAAAFAARERVDRLVYTNDRFPTTAVRNLRSDHLRALAEAFAPALTCRFRLDDLPVLEATAQSSDHDLGAMFAEIDGQEFVKFEFILNKTLLAANRIAEPPSRSRVYLYLFPDAFERDLALGLPEIERLLWPEDGTTKAIVLVQSRDVALDGPYLAVIGGSALDGWQRRLTPTPSDSTPAQRMHATCRQILKWQDDWLKWLTPLHLAFDAEIPDDGLVADSLLLQETRAAVLYTADRTVARSGEWLATFASPQHSIDVPLSGAVRALTTEERAGARALVDLVEWAYDPAWYGNRLALVQVGMATALRMVEPVRRMDALLYSAPTIGADLKWHWKSFIAGKIDSYSAEIRDLEDAVVDATQGFADQTAKIVDRLTTTVLAAVAVLFGSFIAALFKDEFDPTIFRIGMGVYAVYVVCFPLILGTLHEWQRLQGVRDAFSARRARFEEALPVDRVREIVGDRVDSGVDAARSWFYWTVGIYAAVVLMAAAAGIFVPGWIVDGSEQPSNAAAPTAEVSAGESSRTLSPDP